MNLTLTYDGDLPSTGNKPKPGEVSQIRNVFHNQLAGAWESHVVLRQLARTARVPYATSLGPIVIPEKFELPEHREAVIPAKNGEIDLCAPIALSTGDAFIPLVRRSLHLVCALDINFLRQEDPGSLVLQGGDLDGRMKALFDALRVPTKNELKAGTPLENPLYCLLESDTLISDLSIKTGRLFGKRAAGVHHVVLTINVTIKVLRVFPQNECLMGA